MPEEPAITIRGSRALRRGVLRMNSHRGVDLSRIQRQGNAVNHAGVHSQKPSSLRALLADPDL